MKTTMKVDYELTGAAYEVLSEAADILDELIDEVEGCSLTAPEKERVQKRIKEIVDDIVHIVNDEMI